MSTKEILCTAISSKNLVQFHYALGNDPGTRIVEPHMVAYNEQENIALSAWFLRGHSESQEGQGWREYLFDGISSLTILPEKFNGFRPGYKPDGGQKFHNVQCGL